MTGHQARHRDTLLIRRCQDDRGRLLRPLRLAILHERQTAAERDGPASALSSQERRRAMDVSTARDDPRDWLVRQNFDAYTETDHETWRTLARRQHHILKGRIADTFLDGLDALGIDEAGIPDFRVLNERLGRATGWEVVAVPGLVPDIIFFKLLAGRRFPAGYWIRKPEQLDYIQEPDVFHDVFGHVPLIMQPV